MSDLPTGTITFLFTDIEGHTKLWEQYPEAMKEALARHDALLRSAIEMRGGYIFTTAGDAFCSAFAVATAALAAALDAQHALARELWGETGPLHVRMGLHAGIAEERDGDYFGPAVIRAARLMSIGSGGQVLLSQAAYEQLNDELPEGVALRDLGDHRLKDLVRPERVFQAEGSGLQAIFPPLKSLDHFAHNLPVQPTRFIGREGELVQIKDLFQRERLVTLTGPGGVGKTRLSLQVASELLEEHADGVWYIELAALVDSTLVAATVATVLGVREQSSHSLQADLIDFLRDKRLLLILDNCEHLIDACAELAETLLLHCEQLRILATSREALGIGGERHWPVSQLRCPPESTALAAANLDQYEAVQLFVDRACSVRPNFAISSENAADLVHLCAQLEGIPLAIELAAVRIKALSIGQICQRINDRFRLLTGGRRTAQRRQQTLEATVEWSYNLLSESEQILFNTISIFRGGWNLAAAEAIAAVDVFDELTSLVDKSLVSATEPAAGAGTEKRYDMLETLRAYGMPRAAEDAMARHATYYLNLARTANQQLTGPQQSAALHRLTVEASNLREAQNFAIDRGDSDLSSAIGSALALFYELRGAWAEGIERLNQAAALDSTTSPTRVQLAIGLGRLYWRRGEFDQALSWNTAARDQALQLNDRPGLTEAQIDLGHLFYSQGDIEKARAHYEESLRLARQSEDGHTAARALHSLGVMADAQGQNDEAAQLIGEGLTLFRTLGDTLGIARALHILGVIAHNNENYAEAQQRLEEGLVLFRSLDNTLGIARALHVLGQVALSCADSTKAQQRLTESLAIFRTLDNTRDIMVVLCALGIVSIKRREAESAQQQLTESLALARQLDDERYMRDILYQWSNFQALREDFEQQVGLLANDQLWRERQGDDAEMAQRVREDLVAIKKEWGSEWLAVVRRKVRQQSMREVVDKLLSQREVL